MGDFNFLSTEINMDYIGIKIFLSSLRKTLRDCYYFCCCQGVSTFQVGRWGFSSRAGNSFSLLHSPFPIWGNYFKDSASPAALQVLWALSFFVPTHHLPSGERQQPQGWPHVNMSPFPSIPTWWDMFLPVSRDKDNLPITEISTFFIFFLVEEPFLMLCELISYHVLHNLNAPPTHTHIHLPFFEMRVVYCPSEQCAISLPWN